MRRPAYDLAELQAKVRAGEFRVTLTAKRTALAADLTHEDVPLCVLGLTRRDYYKTMRSRSVPGLWQDVYRPVYRLKKLYVKLQIDFADQAVVISFKELWAWSIRAPNRVRCVEARPSSAPVCGR